MRHLYCSILSFLFVLCTQCAVLATEYSFLGKLTASDTVLNDHFGYSVSISKDGESALVGAVVKDSYAGAAYVFEKSCDGDWSQPVELTASDVAGGDYFGISVDISSDGLFALVGAMGDSSSPGAAYIFGKTSDGSWTQNAKLTASDATNEDYFGYAVSLSGDGGYALVGAYGDDDTGSGSGSAYVFEKKSGENWEQVAKLTATDAGAGDYFGMSVSISEDGGYAVVGAPESDDSKTLDGSAYVFENASGSWQQVDKLRAQVPFVMAYFGFAVSISSAGEFILVGARGNDDAGSWSGSAYVFEKGSGTGWTQVSKLTPSDAKADHKFGNGVSITDDGGYALVGAPTDDIGGVNTGSAYVFEKASDGSWTQLVKLLPPSFAGNDFFGGAVSISNACYIALIGATELNHGNGSAYTYAGLNPPEIGEVSALPSDSGTSATIRAGVTANCATTTATVQYGTSSSSLSDSTIMSSTQCGGSDTTVSTTLTGLGYGTIYYYTISASNYLGSETSRTYSFTTRTTSLDSTKIIVCTIFVALLLFSFKRLSRPKIG